MKHSGEKIHTAYFREARTCYTLEDFIKKLGLKDIEKAKKVVASLKRTGIAKAVNKKDFDLNKLTEDEMEYLITDDISVNSTTGYVLNYVGFAYTDDCLIKCYPKYIDTCFSSEDEAEVKIDNHFKNVLKVIRKINAKNEQIYLYNGQEDSKVFNRLAVALYLLDDYYANGIYSNIQTIIETNGEGEIDWDRTINDTFAILKNNTPYYVELQTVDTQSNEFDYFKLLHECVLTQCSQQLEKAGILELFDMSPVELNGMALSDFGDDEYIKYRLEKEIQTQFITKKQTLLKTLYTYIAESKLNRLDNYVSLYGTNAFNMIWEKVCAAVFDNKLNTKFKDFISQGIISTVPTNPNYLPEDPDSKRLMGKNDRLIDLIERSKWRIKEDILKTQETLIPDIISIENDAKTFIILDAKYYFIETDKQTKNIYHQPGIQDVVKQFAYNNAFRDFIFASKFQKIGNGFLIPQKTYETDEKKPITIIGDVTLNLMQNFGFETLAPIQVIEVNPSYLFACYLSGHMLTSHLISDESDFIFKNIER